MSRFKERLYMSLLIQFLYDRFSTGIQKITYRNFDITWLAQNDNNENVDNLPFTIIPP